MRLCCALLAVMSLGVAVGAGTAQAEGFGIVPGSLSIETLDKAGKPENRAGSHPDRMRVDFAENAAGTGTAMKDAVVEFPPGVSGDPNAVPPCPRQLFDKIVGASECPASAQIGIATLTVEGSGDSEVPIFSIQPAPGELATFGFNLFGKFPMTVTLRPTDYGMDIVQSDFGQVLIVSRVQLELWGVPADHQEGTSIPRRPFLTLPTRCGTPLGLTLKVRSWEPLASWLSASATTGEPLEGCEALAFEPQLGFDLSRLEPDVPTGAQIEIGVPQREDPDGPASSQLRSATVSMPAGMTVSPGGAADLQACTDAQLGLGEGQRATCPSRSRIGSVELSGPSLSEPLNGDVFIGEEHPGDRFRLFVVAMRGETTVKVVGSLRPDPSTGRLTTVLRDLPQVGFDRLVLRLDGGGRALLVDPLACGPAAADASFAPYSGGAPVSSSAKVTIGGANCVGPPPFSPGFVAGVTDARAGHPTSFSTTLRRADGEQSPERLRIDFPPGLSARLGSVEPCTPGPADLGSCSERSRIGTAVAEVGSAADPAALAGRVFLTGPYRGAPFGMALAFDAKLGPFDLGELVVRARVRLDPLSGRVAVETDALPQAIEGLPVRFHAIGLDIDRPGFIRNPTSCERAAVAATVTSASGALAKPSSPFAIRGCAKLGFRPQVAMRLTGRSRGRGDVAGLQIAVRSRRGDTNLRAADILLPPSLSFDGSRLRAICSRRDASEGACPANSSVGAAYARSPLTRSPLRGAIYVVQPEGAGLPDLWTDIRGEGIRLETRSTASLEDGRIETKLVDLPDLPLTKFVMRLDGGKRGALALRHDPCAGRDRETGRAGLEGQDGAFRVVRVAVGVPACKSESPSHASAPPAGGGHG